jgi:hypothetical protein
MTTPASPPVFPPDTPDLWRNLAPATKARRRKKADALIDAMDEGDLAGFSRILKTGVTLNPVVVVRRAPCEMAGDFLRLILPHCKAIHEQRLWNAVMEYVDINKGCEVAMLDAGILPGGKTARHLWAQLWSKNELPYPLFHALAHRCPVTGGVIDQFWKALRENYHDNDVLLELWLKSGLPLMPPPEDSRLTRRCQQRIKDTFPWLVNWLSCKGLDLLVKRIETGDLAFLKESRFRHAPERLWSDVLGRSTGDSSPERMRALLRLGMVPPARTHATFVDDNDHATTESISWPTWALTRNHPEAFAFLVQNPLQARLFCEDAQACPLTFFSDESALVLPPEALHLLDQAGLDLGLRQGPGRDALLHRFFKTLPDSDHTLQEADLVLFDRHARGILQTRNKKRKAPMDFIRAEGELALGGGKTLPAAHLRARLEKSLLQALSPTLAPAAPAQPRKRL